MKITPEIEINCDLNILTLGKKKVINNYVFITPYRYYDLNPTKFVFILFP